MSDISIAIAGCGQWGSNHVRTFGNMPGVKVKYLVDADPKRLTKAQEIVRPAVTTADLGQALKDPDVTAVVIATNSESHHDLAKQALLAGKHVMVEKPLALNVRDAEDLVETAAARKLVLMVGHLLLYHPAVRYLKDHPGTCLRHVMFSVYSDAARAAFKHSLAGISRCSPAMPISADTTDFVRDQPILSAVSVLPRKYRSATRASFLMTRNPVALVWRRNSSIRYVDPW